MDRLEHNLGGHIPSYPDMSAMTRLPWQQPLPTNGALIILQLWASGGRTREPILMKFGTLLVQKRPTSAPTIITSATPCCAISVRYKQKRVDKNAEDYKSL